MGWKAGQIVWKDATGKPVATGGVFAGVALGPSEAGHVVTATRGTVPVLLAQGTKPGQPVMANPGEWWASNEGAVSIGMLAHARAVPEVAGGGDARLMGMVRLGHGGERNRLPFWPDWEGGELAGTYLILSTGGQVIERETKTLDAPTILWQVEDFPETAIADGESLFVEWIVTLRGAIESAQFVIAPTDLGKEVARYFPPAAGATEGTAGLFRVELAAFTVVEGKPELERKACGGHLTHVQDLPTLMNLSEGSAQVFKGFDAASGRYEFRPLVEGVEAQVKVRVVGDEVVVEGNEKKGKLRYKVGDSSPVEVLSWIDGLVDTEADQLIDIPAPPLPGDGPDGDNFNIGLRSLNFSQYVSEPVHISMNAGTSVTNWIYVRSGLLYTDRAKVATPDDGNDLGAGAVYPRLILMLPISGLALPSGNSLEPTGGWITVPPA